MTEIEAKIMRLLREVEAGGARVAAGLDRCLLALREMNEELARHTVERDRRRAAMGEV